MEQQKRVRLGEGGRLVIPASLRQRHGLEIGKDVVLDEEQGHLVVKSMTEAIREGIKQSLAIMDQCLDPKGDAQNELRTLRDQQLASESIESGHP
jgi:bifunctional DNA-binding transcriptional regulator/antitoxin component of YhaV-PrlF toxin-antitoxin module